eukprot:scaffold34610_cov50-Attheya_sp.AAC.7
MMNLFGKKKAPVASAVSSTSSSGGSDPSTAVVTLRQSIKTQEKRRVLLVGLELIFAMQQDGYVDDSMAPWSCPL